MYVASVKRFGFWRLHAQLSMAGVNLMLSMSGQSLDLVGHPAKFRISRGMVRAWNKDGWSRVVGWNITDQKIIVQRRCHGDNYSTGPSLTTKLLITTTYNVTYSVALFGFFFRRSLTLTISLMSPSAIISFTFC